jgi:hypothetical protein
MFSGDRPDFQTGQLGQVRSLQIQMEGLEQAQGELLQQLRKAGAGATIVSPTIKVSILLSPPNFLEIGIGENL